MPTAIIRCKECGSTAAEFHELGCSHDQGKQVRYDSPLPYDMSIHTNPDARAWVKFFRESNPDCNVPDDVMFGWFVNAMMAMHDHIKAGPAVLPDGSAFFAADVQTPPAAA